MQRPGPDDETRDDDSAVSSPQHDDHAVDLDDRLRDVFDRYRRSDHPGVVFVREVLTSAAMVAALGIFLFAISGVWPPMVAIESPSMEPHMHKGDLVFIMEEHRLVPDGAEPETGVLPYEVGQDTGYTRFGLPGDVIVYERNGGAGTPIIHRSMFWVDEGENWYDRADPAAIGGADDCVQLANCPAPQDGFITKGDNNRLYDQVNGLSDPVKPEWIIGTAEVRVPWLGCVRLFFSQNGNQCGFGTFTAGTAGSLS